MGKNSLKNITVRIIANTPIALLVTVKGRAAWLRKDVIQFDEDAVAPGRDIIIKVPEWHIESQGLRW